MKRNFIMTLAYALMSVFSIAQSQGNTTPAPAVAIESEPQISNSGYIEKSNYRNPSQDIIDKNGGVIFAEVSVVDNLTHVFQGKVDNSEFDRAFEVVKTFKFIETISISESKVCSVTFIHGIAESEIRSFYETLGYSGFLIKK